MASKPISILVTGFGPFPGAPFNPTAALVQRLARQPDAIPGVRVAGHVFRTSYAVIDAELPGLIRQHEPQVVLMFGLAARTPFLRIETIARNSRSVLFPDAGGARSLHGVIAAGGPTHLRGRAPVVPLLAAVRAVRLPVKLSRNAGRYLCNYAYWRAAELSGAAAPRLVLFVHVPKLRCSPRPLRVGARTFTDADLLRAAQAILRVMAAAARRV